MADHNEFRDIIRPGGSMTGPNDFKYSEEYYRVMSRNRRRLDMVPLPHANNIEELTKNRTAPKPSNEEIALRLVESWARQTNFSVICDGIVDRYFEALDRLNENESKDA